MGGHAFKTDGKRMCSEDAYDLTIKIFELLSREFSTEEIVIPHFPLDKPDYGDIDFGLSTNDNEDWVERISKAINADAFKGAGTQYSFLVDGKQVDFNLSPEGSQKFAYFNTLHSFTGGIMKALVKNIDRSFKMNDSGVYCSVGHGVYKKPLMDMMTNSPSTFLKAMDIPQDYLDEDLRCEDVIEMFAQSKQMPTPEDSMKRFMEAVSGNENKSYSESLIFQALSRMKETRSQEERKQFFLNTMIENGYDPSITKKMVENKTLSKERFNGQMVSKITGAKGIELGEVMSRFKKGFESEEEMDKFIISSSDKELKKRVLKNVEYKGLSL